MSKPAAPPPVPPPRVPAAPPPLVPSGDAERDAADRRAREIEVRLQSRGIRDAQCRARKVGSQYRLVIEVPLEAAERIAPR